MSAFSVDMDNVNLIADETAIPMIKKPFSLHEINEAVEELLILTKPVESRKFVGIIE